MMEFPLFRAEILAQTCHLLGNRFESKTQLRTKTETRANGSPRDWAESEPFPKVVA